MNQEKQTMVELTVEEKAKELRRAAAKAHYQKNRTEILKKRRLKRQENLQEELEKERKYRAENPDKVKKWNENYWKKKAKDIMNKEA